MLTLLCELWNHDICGLIGHVTRGSPPTTSHISTWQRQVRSSVPKMLLLHAGIAISCGSSGVLIWPCEALRDVMPSTTVEMTRSKPPSVGKDEDFEPHSGLWWSDTRLFNYHVQLEHDNSHNSRLSLCLASYDACWPVPVSLVSQHRQRLCFSYRLPNRPELNISTIRRCAVRTTTTQVRDSHI